MNVKPVLRCVTKALAILFLLGVTPSLTAGGEIGETETAPPVQAARGVLERLIPDRAGHFVLESCSSENGCDVFEIESRDGKIVLRGSTGVAICSALNWYLKYYCHADVSWSGTQLDLPEPLPPMQRKVHRVSPHKYRYFFNYCCFGYSLPWWDWPDWERIIDWMALNGINMPLAVAGQEATWRAVMRELGMNDEQIHNFLAGPPYLPFGWMGCLDGWGGPLPQPWIDRHLDLQKNILARERELGMMPVLQGFTGHVPKAVKEKFPNAKLHQIHWIEWDSYFIDPLDPLFQRIGKIFLETQQRDFGTNHLYAADTFIEMTPPSDDPAFLTNMGKTLYETMKAADPEAIWVMQGWIFYHNAKFWNPPQVKAFLGGVPDDRMILLDLFCDVSPVWNKTESFHGKPWIWCILQNFGNTVRMSGPLAKINQDLHEALSSPERGNLSGIGMIQEGLGYNPIVFDFMTEMTWRNRPVDPEKWVEKYAYRRYGQKNIKASQAWKLLLETVYSDSFGPGSAICARPDTSGKRSSWPKYNRDRFKEAWDLLLQCSDELHDVDTYRFDLANETRQALSNLSNLLYGKILEAYEEKDRKMLASASDEFLQLIRDLDELLATRKEFLLGKWLEDAKRWGTNDEEKRLYEWNARNVITLWGGRESQLHDYARKEWSGLLTGFYLPRWEMFLKQLGDTLAKDEPLDEAGFERNIQLWEENWTHQTENYPSEVNGDTIAVARRLHEKYASLGNAD
ncbi:MAG: alpha-N-acetylglucosaminidase [bacterium]